MAKITESCSVCGTMAPTMLVRNYEAVCFDCFAKNHPEELAQLRDYLTVAQDKANPKRRKVRA